MPLPQVNERIKEVPAQALRAVFAGIGQVLLVADKIRHRAAGQISSTMVVTAPPGEAPPKVAASAPKSAPAAKPPAKPSAAPPAKRSGAASGKESAPFRPLDKTGNVTLIPDSGGKAAASAPPDPGTATSPATTPPADQAPAEVQAAQAPVATPAAEPGTLPLSNYDELSVPSLRARLRVLSGSQISTLLEYEKATERRPEVIIMFERRLAKLEQENG